ncbi:MAG: FecR domain-containing protein [Dehalococcoidia bacterium]
MSTSDLATVIDRCLDDLVAGRASVAECLDRYPEHRAALEPLLSAAASMQAVPRRPERAPDRVRRAQFMELIRETPQERRSWFPALAGLLGGAFLPRLAAAVAPVALALAIGAFLLVSQPSTPAAASTLTVFAGAAEEQVDGQWQPLADGAAVRQGARIRTNAEGHVLLTFPDGSTSSLDPSTEIAIEALSAGSPRTVQIRQFSGRLWNDVVTDQREGARYEVLTADATVQVHGTVFETSIDNGQTSVATSEGEVAVVVGDERVSVPSGEIVRARGQRVAERAQVQRAGSLTVDAPFAAALVSERGEATGARTDGAIFRQIRGVTTSNPGDGPQRFDFQRLPPGDYTLVLQRFEQGDGELVLNVNGEEHRIPLDAASAAAQVRVRVALEDGRPRVELAEDRPRPAPATQRPPVRIVETQRTRQAPDIAAQRAAAAARRQQNPPREGAGTAPAAVGASATRGTGPAPASAFVARLRDAVGRNDAAAIRALVDEAATNGDAEQARVQLLTLSALLNNDENAERVTAALGADSGLRQRLLDRADVVLSGEMQDRLRRNLSGEPRPTRTERPSEDATPRRTPSAERTPTPGAPRVPDITRPEIPDIPRPVIPRPGATRPDATRPTPTPDASAEATRTSTPRASRPPVLPTAVDGFAIRLRVALGTRNDEAIRRALADAVSGSEDTRRARLAALADAVENGENARRVTDALAGDEGASLRDRLLSAARSTTPGEDGLIRLLGATSTVTATATPTVTATPTATPSATATASPTGTATATATGTATAER